MYVTFTEALKRSKGLISWDDPTDAADIFCREAEKPASTAGKRDPYWARQFSCATRRVAFAASSVGLFSSPRVISASIISE